MPDHLSVSSYYEEIRRDHRALTLRNGYPHFHMGYYGDGQTSHRDAATQMSALVCEGASMDDRHLVLDLGCGYGATCLFAAKTFRAKLVGLSNTYFFLHEAQQLVRKIPSASPIQFVSADMHSIPFHDGCFDGIIAIESVAHSSNLSLLYTELSRVLSNDGLISVADFFVDPLRICRANEKTLTAWTQAWHVSMQSVDQHARLAASAGLRLLSRRNISSKVEKGVARMSRLARLAFPINALAYNFGLRSQVQHHSTTAAKSMPDLLRCGALQYFHLVFAGSQE
jgi:cyclopropane fatty-acyl-phospholipid synthase-like methyltransferase